MQEKIGTTAGAIWQALNVKGELTPVQLKRAVKGKVPIFDWAIGWLAREEKIVITPEKRSFRIRLREAQAKTAAPS
ncbi:MAG: winged helix-turn-helix domain-containing protein [Candidatus Acidiferrales bacterium]